MAKKTLSAEEVAKLRQIDAYDHKDKKRYNNPPAEMARYDKDKGEVKQYAYDPNIDPSLQWAGKAEHEKFTVPTTSIHIHESIKPSKILKDVETIGEDTRDVQPTLFGETPLERMKKRQQALEFYKHGVDWTNRLIAGDSLIVMNSLLQKEGMAGQVQMVYIDPPYGIKYGSNFQPFVNKTSVTDKKDSDIDSTPEQITAFRDTWELGIHSYLTYLRDRILLAHELLSDTGSLFVQISDTNAHYVRIICDEIFGRDNFVSQIFYQKSANSTSKTLPSVGDYLIWYAKHKHLMKYHQIYLKKQFGGSGSRQYQYIKLKNGETYTIHQWEQKTRKIFVYNDRPQGSHVFRLAPLTSEGISSTNFSVNFNGKTYSLQNEHWKTNKEGIDRLIQKNRVYGANKILQYIRYFEDFPYYSLNNLWSGFGTESKLYVVQTATEIVKRCILMSTDPGDLVLDPTCGSGTTAYVAEQWGRRWITIDTSRVAIELAKQRLITATFDYYQLAHPDVGVDSGFKYKTTQHIRLQDIAKGLEQKPVILYDSPLVDKTKIRISGPFTVEAVPAPTVQSLDSNEHVESNLADEQDYWQKELLASGIWGRDNKRIEFSHIEKLTETHYIQALATTKEDHPRQAAICFGSTKMPLDARAVSNALDEAQDIRPTPQIVVFAAFQFDPEAKTEIENIKWPGVTLLKAQMNDDLLTADLKKKRSSDQSFMLIGEPDVDLVADGRSHNRYKVVVKGWDYYNVAKGEIDSGSADRIAMWMLDTDYDGMCIEPMQVFFPMGGRNGGWQRLAKTLKAEINQQAIQKYAGTESIWFTAKPGQKVAVKIVDDRGIESMKVLTVGGEN